METHKNPHRVPGYPMQYVNAEEMEEASINTIHKFDVHGDGTVGVPVRTATKKDAERMGTKPKPSPII
jgi:hypothetical protein